MAINPGSNPKVITSANESRSLPMGLVTFNALAMNPSVKSKKAAMNIAYEA